MTRQRPALVRIDQHADDAEARVVITLEWQDNEYLGTASGDAAESARPRLLGEATLRAVEALTPSMRAMVLEAIATTDLGDSQVAMAQVDAGGGDHLVGSALLRREDPWAAPVRAVLDAVNRRMLLEL